MIPMRMLILALVLSASTVSCRHCLRGHTELVHIPAVTRECTTVYDTENVYSAGVFQGTRTTTRQQCTNAYPAYDTEQFVCDEYERNYQPLAEVRPVKWEDRHPKACSRDADCPAQSDCRTLSSGSWCVSTWMVYPAVENRSACPPGQYDGIGDLSTPIICGFGQGPRPTARPRSPIEAWSHDLGVS